MNIACMVREDDQSQALAKTLKAQLIAAGHLLNETNPDLVIFVGGDGTFLRSIQQYLPRLNQLTFVGIHSGTLGFFCEYHADQISQLVQHLPKMVMEASTYPLVEISLMGKKKTSFYAVNEVRVENPFHTFVTDVYVNDQHLQTFRGTGLIVASTLGSSAYNKSLGGALVDASIPSLQLTEMATIQNNAYRSLGSSLVLDAKKKITFKGDFAKAIVGYDYLLAEINEHIQEIQVTTSPLTFKLYHQKQHPYFDTLKKTFVKNRD
ncbi:MAG: NAD kinase [Bacilli bacterium]